MKIIGNPRLGYCLTPNKPHLKTAYFEIGGFLMDKNYDDND